MKIIQFVISYKVLLPTGIVILLGYVLKSNSNYIRIRGLFKEYVNIFEGSKFQIVFFFGIPMLFALSFVQLGEFTENSFNTIYVVATIFITMFFSVLTVLLGKEKNYNTEYFIVLHQTINTILFEIVMCIYTVLYSFIFQIIRNLLDTKFNKILSFGLFYILFFMVLNMFVVVKRFKVLIGTTDSR